MIEQQGTEVITDDKGNPTTQAAEIERPRPSSDWDPLVHLARAIRAGLGTADGEFHHRLFERALPLQLSSEQETTTTEENPSESAQNRY